MDELWQRYRSFWVPLLVGVGVFLVGLIAVHLFSDDPEVQRLQVASRESALARKFEPPAARINAVRANAERLQEDVLAWARKLDQAALGDPLAHAVETALRSAILRGASPDAVAAKTEDALARFDDDGVAAGMALDRYRAVLDDRLALLRTGDPNVGFSRLLSDVWSELRVRANRADVDVEPVSLGYENVKSVTRATLLERVLNLALVSELMDIGIRSRLESIAEIRFENRANPEAAEVFLREYPVTLAVEGDMDAIRPIVDRITDAARPYPVTKALFAQPRRGDPRAGLVRFEVTVSSTLVQPAASLELEKEEE